MILMINSSKRINEHKNGFDGLKSENASDFLSLKVFHPLQLVEKIMKMLYQAFI